MSLQPRRCCSLGFMLGCLQGITHASLTWAVTITRMQPCLALSPHQAAPEEDIVHLLTRCRCTAATRTMIIPDLMNLLSYHFPRNDILVHPNHTHLTQLILDLTSLNLPMNICISPDHPALPAVLTMCRNLCFFIDKDITQQLRLMKEQAALQTVDI